MKKLTKSQLRQIILQEIGTMRMPQFGTHRDRAGYRGATVRGRVERRMPTVEKMAAQMGMDAADLADLLADEIGMNEPAEEVEMVMGSGQDPADLGPLAEAAYNRIVERRRQRDLNEGLSGDLKKLVDYMAQKGMKYSVLGGMAVMSSIGGELIDMVADGNIEGAAERFMDSYGAL